jgi:hypothetical protein
LCSVKSLCCNYSNGNFAFAPLKTFSLKTPALETCVGSNSSKSSVVKQGMIIISSISIHGRLGRFGIWNDGVDSGTGLGYRGN